MPLDMSWEPKGQHTVITETGPLHLNIRRVLSSNIEWVGWPRVIHDRWMVVQFKDGSRYAYFGVSRQRVVACAYAVSTGSYFQRKIRKTFRTMKLR